MHHWAVKSNLLTVLLPYPTLVCLQAWPKLPCYAGYVKATAYNVGIFWGKQKLPWLHAIFDFITQVDWQENTNYNTWSRCRAEEGDGRGGGEKKIFLSSTNTSPAPHESAHCLDYFRIQHCGYTNKNNHTRRENARNAGCIKAYWDFKGVVMSSVLKNLVMTTLKLYSQQILTLIEIFLKIQKIILQFEYRITDSHWYNYK